MLVLLTPVLFFMRTFTKLAFVFLEYLYIKRKCTITMVNSKPILPALNKSRKPNRVIKFSFDNLPSLLLWAEPIGLIKRDWQMSKAWSWPADPSWCFFLNTSKSSQEDSSENKWCFLILSLCASVIHSQIPPETLACVLHFQKLCQRTGEGMAGFRFSE